MAFPAIAALLGSLLGGSKDDQMVMRSGSNFSGGPAFQTPTAEQLIAGAGGSAAPSALSAQSVADQMAMGASGASGEAMDGLKKQGAGAFNAIQGVLGALGSVDKRLTDVQYPNRPMGVFAPNPNPGLIGIELMLRELAARGGR